MPLEEFYVNTPNGPDISQWLENDPPSNKVYNCSIHCGREYCGSGPIFGEPAGRGSIVGYPSSALDMNMTATTSQPPPATAG